MRQCCQCVHEMPVDVSLCGMLNDTMRVKVVTLAAGLRMTG